MDLSLRGSKRNILKLIKCGQQLKVKYIKIGCLSGGLVVEIFITPFKSG